MVSMTEEEINEVLLTTPGFAQGMKPLIESPGVFVTLLGKKLIGSNGGLTRKGSIRTERLKSAQLDRLFG